MQATLMDTEAELDNSKTQESIQIDDLHFVIQRSAKRRSMQITLERTGELFVTAPPQVSVEQLTAFVTEKRLWVYTKLAEKGIC
jgi:predicted metal-dependent hydrolase